MRLFDLDETSAHPEAAHYAQKQFDSEYELESLLHANQDLLLDEEIFVFNRQPSLNPGKPDLVALDTFGNVVVFELKKGLSGTGSASEDSIISQPQQYARALAPFNYDDLDELFQKYRNQVESGKWDMKTLAIPGETLAEAFETRFGKSLQPEWFNQQQRAVVIAEEITDQTAQNARYLQDQGLNIQCQEVRQYHIPEDSDNRTFLVSNTVVDYDLREVRPDHHGKPIYEDISREVVNRTLGYVGEVVWAQNPSEVVSDFARRQPIFRSRNPDHPEEIEYSLRVKPIENNTVRIAVDVKDGDEAVESIRSAEHRYRELEFEVSSSRSRYRVVQFEWSVDAVEPLYDEVFQDEIASKFAELIETTHEVCSLE